MWAVCDIAFRRISMIPDWVNNVVMSVEPKMWVSLKAEHSGRSRKTTSQNLMLHMKMAIKWSTYGYPYIYIYEYVNILFSDRPICTDSI